MKKKFKKIVSAIFVSTTILLTTGIGVEIDSVQAADDTFTVIHTNDMHGRLNQELDSSQGTLLSRLNAYVGEYNPDLLVDGGDAIQGLPMANLNKGEYMIDAMMEIGYDAMTVGNHEFDFGYDNLMEIKDKLSGENTMSILSSNVEKDGQLSFTPYEIYTKDDKKVAVIGLTTPETLGKTHPNNTEGVTFLDIETQSKKFIDEILEENDDIDLIVPIAHLGADGETKDDERGDILSKKLADYLVEKESEVPLLFVDGHSHTEEEDTFGRDNLLYVQTGEHLNNIGHVEIDFDDFTESTAKLVPTEDLQGGDPLKAEEDATDFFGDIAKEVILEDLPYHFNGQREHVRTHETNLGNLIGDAMVAYGEELKNKPDLAVMNGGGIREDLKAGEVNRADVISVIPFGNTYASIEVTGEAITKMFEHSYRTPIQEDEDGNYLEDELGNYLLEPNGGFLQVSGNVKIEYNALEEPGNRIVKIMIEQDGDWEELEKDKTYTLATNDFLAQGGDYYDMLGGDRIEGDSLDDVFARFLQSDDIDWEQYKDEYNPTRIMQVNEPISDKDDEEEKEAVKVDEKITALPKASELTLKDKEAVISARQSYESLSDEAKGFVTKLEDLEKLEQKIIELEKDAAEKAEKEKIEEEAKKVDEKISELPKVSDLTLDDKKAVESARQAYDKLSDKAKELVTNLNDLEKAEERIKELEKDAQTKEDTDGDKKENTDEENKEDKDGKGKLPKTGEAENNVATLGVTIIVIGLGGLTIASRKKSSNQ